MIARLTPAEVRSAMQPKRGVRIKVADKSERTYGGRLYASASEMKFAMNLDLQKRAGVIDEWRPQVPFTLTVNGKKIGRMTVDFSITTKGVTRYVEVKGQETEAFRLRKKLLLACYPEIDYEVVKAR